MDNRNPPRGGTSKRTVTAPSRPLPASRATTRACVTPGASAVVAQTDFGRVGFAICFDLNFRDVAEGNRTGGAELVLFPSMYAGGLQLSIWAHDFGFFIASATPRDGGR